MGDVALRLRQHPDPLPDAGRRRLPPQRPAGQPARTRWTLLDRSGAELLAECERRGVKVVAAAPIPAPRRRCCP